MAEIRAYVLIDIENIEKDTLSIVPFDMKDRIVRTIRLKHDLLLFNWAEKEPYHKLTELEEVTVTMSLPSTFLQPNTPSPGSLNGESHLEVNGNCII